MTWDPELAKHEVAPEPDDNAEVLKGIDWTHGEVHSVPRPNDIMNLPGLPGYTYPRPTFFPACLPCFQKACTHDHELRFIVAAITIKDGDPVCGDCVFLVRTRRA